MTRIAPHEAHWPRRLPRALVIPETTLWFNAQVSARRYPHKAMYNFLGRELSFAAFETQALAIAGWLQAHGVQPGDRVMVLMQNCPQYAVAFYGALRAQAVVVPVNPMNRSDELGHYITDPGVRVALVSADLASALTQASERLEPSLRLQHMLVTHYADTLPPREEADVVPPAMADWLYARHPLPSGATPWLDALDAKLAPSEYTGQPDDLAILPYTSGTTALPKGCMHTHRTLMPNVVNGEWSYASAATTSLGVVPMFHITGMMYGVHSPLWLG